MKRNTVFRVGLVIVFFVFHSAAGGADANEERDKMDRIVSAVILPLMAKNDIPGMAIAITVRGKSYFFNYGVVSIESGRQVTEDTIFEIGSVSKIFTSLLVGYAQAKSSLSISDVASRHLPDLADSCFDRITLLELGTYTAGGLPLQFPDSVYDAQTMLAYYRNWSPSYAAGTRRLYSNPSIGLMGYLAARSMNVPFDDLMEKTIFPKMGLGSTFINIPQEYMNAYAYGYSKTNKPIRVIPGVLGGEAYGVKTTAADLLRFIVSNMDAEHLEQELQQGIATTRTGYFMVGDMTQGLGWEMYDYPASLAVLLAGNSSNMILEPNEATRITPPRPPKRNVLMNKTGSTNGFGAYVACIPEKMTGIVMLANRNYPNSARVEAAFRILTELDTQFTLDPFQNGSNRE